VVDPWWPADDRPLVAYPTLSLIRLSGTGGTGGPDWHEIAAEDFDTPLTRQGLSGVGDVLFAGPRRGTSLWPDASLRDITLGDLPGRGIPAGATVSDLSAP
jgi:hypothetical protein